MNLYDAYTTPRDRASCPAAAEAVEVLARVLPIGGAGAPPERPTRPMEGCPDGSCQNPACGEDDGRFPSLAMVFAPMQCFRQMYEPSEGLSRGTLFRELDKPLERGGRR